MAATSGRWKLQVVTIVKGEKTLLAVALFVILAMPALATELGVNYYHESMVSQQWGVPYIPVSIDQVQKDFDKIKTISNHIKFYMNPFVDKNLPWVEQLAVHAESRGMYTVVNMMVDDRNMNDGNWGDYSNRVLQACSRLNGKVDEILVGNELVLHSPWDKYTVRAKVEPLIKNCKARFSGKVSYEAFWFAKEAWYSYPGEIYFMMYENLASFTYNVGELHTRFGSRGIVGEWGEDSIDEHTQRDDWWMRTQLESRWNVIRNNNIPVAYIFTYREPSWNGFGIIRPDGKERPVWDFLRTLSGQQACVPSGEVCDGRDNDCDGQADENNVCGTTSETPTASSGFHVSELPVKCTADSCQIKSDVTQGVCRSVAFSTAKGTLSTQVCEKTDGQFEAYRQSAPSGLTYEVCFANGCITQNNGFARFQVQIADEPVCVPSGEVCDGRDNDCDGQADENNVCSAPSTGDFGSWDGNIKNLKVTCTAPGCTMAADSTTGVCRVVTHNTNNGQLKVQACIKDSGYVEMYTQRGISGAYSVCLDNGCVTEHNGFERFKPDGSSATTSSTPTTNSGGLMGLSVRSEPAGTFSGDYKEGTCRKVQFSTSAGWAEAKICEKGNGYYEMYMLTQPTNVNICVGSNCVGPKTGFAGFLA